MQGASSKSKKKRPGSPVDTPCAGKKRRFGTPVPPGEGQDADSPPPSNNSMSMKNGTILPNSATGPSPSANAPVTSGSGSVPVHPSGSGGRGESLETVPLAPAVPSSSDEEQHLKFRTPRDLAGDPSKDTSSPPIPFRPRNRIIVGIKDSKSPFEPDYTLHSLSRRIFVPAALNHPLFDGFLVDFPDVWFIRTTKRLPPPRHDGSVEEGCLIVGSILSLVQGIAEKKPKPKRGKKEAVPVPVPVPVPVRAKFLLVNELPFEKRTWTLPGATGAVEGDVFTVYTSTSWE